MSQIITMLVRLITILFIEINAIKPRKIILFINTDSNDASMVRKPMLLAKVCGEGSVMGGLEMKGGWFENPKLLVAQTLKPHGGFRLPFG